MLYNTKAFALLHLASGQLAILSPFIPGPSQKIRLAVNLMVISRVGVDMCINLEALLLCYKAIIYSSLSQKEENH